MTREEHIYQLIQYLQGRLISMCPASSLYWKEHYEEIIKGLEQEPIFDKVRAEIEKLQKMCDKNDLNLMAQYSAFGMVLEILDKYKAETEAEDGKDD